MSPAPNIPIVAGSGTGATPPNKEICESDGCAGLQKCFLWSFFFLSFLFRVAIAKGVMLITLVAGMVVEELDVEKSRQAR